jgi:ABC-type uncharacterized transport system permease subunit
MENLPSATFIVFLLGQVACFGAYIFIRPAFKIIVILQCVIAIFTGLMWVGHMPSFSEFDAPLLAHILSVILAHWFLVFSFVGGILVAVKEKSLKSHKLGKSLPSLQELEKTQFQMLSLALGAMLSSVVLGEWYLYSIHNVLWMWNIKTILSLSLCIGIGALLFMHHKWGTRGRKAAGFVLFFYFAFIIILGVSHI